jgi:hypothetical protein
LTTSKPIVVSVVGPGRSGTTILGNVLGELPGWFCAGELRWFWKRGLVERRRCACGRVLVECEVWSLVIADLTRRGYALDKDATASATATAASLRSIIAWQDELTPLRVRAKVLRSPRMLPSWPALQYYHAATADLIRATFAVTGARVIVDTSKRAHDAAVAARIDGFDHYVIHVVRDPRAVAYSWGRLKALPGVETQTEMGRRTPLSSVVRWTENCAGAELLRRQLPPDRWLFVKYEDFVRDPRRAVENVLRFVGEPVGQLPVGADQTVILGSNHNVAGNPNRFQTGPVVIREDDEWQRRMQRGDQLKVTAVSWPLLNRYGYPVLLHG